ncbi:helix-turn-helix transcriptional regulator [Limosilactobacillus reuteri]|uniref:helix-turn-helix transcriptional regulator n=1 Tax=Limosilactobacillus reuteri TaxID=1598 RepID=UPI000DEB95B7|nr:helix-turn-helix transcriptional regulator [Limosilactobacillus reuteri]AXX75108.1 helix-turn-helix domain-containing protein [Limosilactobacillus reuteri]MCC4344758.1 helix-turn-helix transcriptional regulator [Limosilactobacillus reuteri]WJK31542.1 helix-turn-helix transcriptional regulator [Limosilactobacillus reuteri]
MEVLPNNTLINLRKNKGLSQAVAAKKIGISQSMLAMLEAGYRKGSDETKVMIANYYGESVESIFFNRIITKCDKNGGGK